jgi:hypothetical protein
MFSNWQDLGIGFTNLQVATQWYEPRDTVDDDDTTDTTVDPADDPELEWKSGDNQETPKVWVPPRPTAGQAQRLTLTLEARSLDRVTGVPTPTLPALKSPVAAALETNQYGDLDAITLPNADPRYDDDYIYRRSTISIELRSAGAGRW